MVSRAAFVAFLVTSENMTAIITLRTVAIMAPKLGNRPLTVEEAAVAKARIKTEAQTKARIRAQNRIDAWADRTVELFRNWSKSGPRQCVRQWCVDVANILITQGYPRKAAWSIAVYAMG